MTILQDLFYGNIAPNAGRLERNSQYAKAMQVIADSEEKLLALLKDAERNLFIDFSDAQSTLNGITVEEKFIQGFKLGALIMIEVTASRNEEASCDY